jgi:hypothetical protein
LVGPAILGREKPEAGHAGLLHGRPDRVSHGGGNARRVGAVASFHGGGLATDMPNSPYLQAAKTKAQFLIEIAENDDKRSPDEKNVLKDTRSARRPARGNRSLPGCAWLVSARFAGVQRASAREGMEPLARSIQ